MSLIFEYNINKPDRHEINTQPAGALPDQTLALGVRYNVPKATGFLALISTVLAMISPELSWLKKLTLIGSWNQWGQGSAQASIIPGGVIWSVTLYLQFCTHLYSTPTLEVVCTPASRTLLFHFISEFFSLVVSY